jgi:hypothetical protein
MSIFHGATNNFLLRNTYLKLVGGGQTKWQISRKLSEIGKKVIECFLFEMTSGIYPELLVTFFVFTLYTGCYR